MSKYVPIKDSPGDGDLKTEKTDSTEANTNENEVNDDEICELEHLRKLFIGGLAAYTSEESLKAFYEQWGKVVDVVVMRDPTTKRSRGFGFITYTKSSMVDKAQENRPHVIDGKTVEAKRALPRPERESRETNISVKKLFVGGLKDNHDEECLKEYFSQFGNVISIKILTDKTTGKRRGFAFIEFDDYDAVDKAILQKSHSIKYVVVDVKKSIYNQEQQNQSANQRALAAPGTNGPQQNKPPPPNKAGPMPPMPNGGYRPPVPPPGHMPPPPYQQPPMTGPPPNYNYWGHPPPPPPPGQHQYGYPPAPMNNWSYPPAPNGWQQPPGPPGPPPGNWQPHNWSAGPPPVGHPPPANWGPPPQQMPPAGPPPPGVAMQQPPVPQPPPPASAAAPVVPGQTPNFGTGYQQSYGGGPAKHSMNQNRMNPYQAGPSNGYAANNGQPPNYGGYNGGGVVPPPTNGSVGKPPAAGAPPPNTPAPVPPVGSKYRR